MPPFDERLKEKLETLDGSRTRARGKAALRIEDVAALLQIPPRMQAIHAAGAAPTKAEFDELLDEVALLRARLLEIAAAVQAKMLP